MGGFYHSYGLCLFYSRVLDFDSGSSLKFGRDAGCEGCALVTDDCLRDVGMLSEYLHEGVRYRFCVWFADWNSEQVAREVIARRQDVRILVGTRQFAYPIDFEYVFRTVAGVVHFFQRGISRLGSTGLALIQSIQLPTYYETCSPRHGM